MLELGHLPHAHQGQAEGHAALLNECERLQAGHGGFLDVVLGAQRHRLCAVMRSPRVGSVRLPPFFLLRAKGP